MRVSPSRPDGKQSEERMGWVCPTRSHRIQVQTNRHRVQRKGGSRGDLALHSLCNREYEMKRCLELNVSLVENVMASYHRQTGKVMWVMCKILKFHRSVGLASFALKADAPGLLKSANALSEETPVSERHHRAGCSVWKQQVMRVAWRLGNCETKCGLPCSEPPEGEGLMFSPACCRCHCRTRRQNLHRPSVSKNRGGCH